VSNNDCKTKVSNNTNNNTVPVGIMIVLSSNVSLGRSFFRSFGFWDLAVALVMIVSVCRGRDEVSE
jgi:hypothetical protein